MSVIFLKFFLGLYSTISPPTTLQLLEDKKYMGKRILTSLSTAFIIKTKGDTDSCSYSKIISTKDKI